jgi:GR25 family glycosyltransferase involved in LPS biosynthesis
MKLNNFVDKIFCINLKQHKDRKRRIIKQSKKYNLKISFFNAINHKNGWEGCLMSHLEIIKIAKKNKYKNILILEDDIIFTTNPDIDVDNLPKKWDLLYLGGNIQTILEEDKTILNNKKWIKMCCLSTKSYIINSNVYDKIINELSIYKNKKDDYFNTIFHPNQTSYIINPPITDLYYYSDIEKTIKEQNTWEDAIEKNLIDSVDFDFDEITKKCKLKLKSIIDEDLPYVSVLTPTKNRKKFFELAIHCFKNYNYPHNKLEWVIVDDSDDGSTLKDILPKDKRIKYVRIKTKRKIPIGEKRNLCMKYVSHDIVVNMDDDDYYMPNSIKTRVKVLLTYPNINVIGCGFVCCYDTQQKHYYHVGNNINMAEASMCFRKKFWEKREFNKSLKMGEGYNLKYRKQYALTIPYNYIMIVLNHKTNITNTERNCNDKEKIIKGSFLPQNVLDIINNIMH